MKKAMRLGVVAGMLLLRAITTATLGSQQMKSEQ
jgi:hypothetical protein